MIEPAIVDEHVTVYNADCIDALAELAEASVDSIVTDPPYGLGFMGKEWDSPGGVGDFPMRRFDALNTVNTGASRQGGRQRSTEDFARRQARDARAYQEWCELWAAACLRVLKPGGHLLAFGGTRTYHRLASAIEDAGFELRDSITWLYGSGFPKSRNLEGEWDGWGTALKPASEPIAVARKSLIGTVAANVAAHRTGALNIAGCRVEAQGRPLIVSHGVDTPGKSTYGSNGPGGGSENAGTTDEGRWPPNVLLDDEAAAALDAQTGILTSEANPTHRSSDKFRDVYGDFEGQEECEPARGQDVGGASRFYPVFRYEPKASDDERPRVGDLAHPTVKPVDLIRWLVRLVTPPAGLVLDPFLGSGTTAQACILEGFRCVGIEREADYLALIAARLERPIQIGLGFGPSAP